MSEQHIKQNKVVSLDSLVPHPRNYRAHPKFQIDRLVLSLQRFGQGRSIVIQDAPEHPVIVAGHGIVEAARALRWQEIRADVLPADWTPEQVEGYLVADNLHSDGASDNEELLAMLLQEQQNAGFDLASLGSDDETLRQMLAEMGDEGLDEGGAADEIPGINAPDLPYKNQFAVAVLCESEDEQKKAYDALVGQGYSCKVLVV